jgi:RNA polymerase sigma-70 factor (ECF subfamily)
MPTLAYSARDERRRKHEASDRELLQAIADRDELALDVLMSRKTALLMQVAYRILGNREEARDVVQVAFIRVWEKASKFNPKWHPNTWLYRITTNLAIDVHRKRMRNHQHQESLHAHYLRVAETKGRQHRATLERVEVDRILEEILSGLSEKQRLVFVLSQQQGLSSGEVGRILGCQASTVRNHLLSARRKLRETLHGRFPEYAMLRMEFSRDAGEEI